MSASNRAVTAPSASFYPNSSKYRSLCSKVHVKTGSLIVGVIEVASLVATGIGVLIEQSSLYLWVLVVLLISAEPLIFLFIGLKKEKSCYIIPHLIYQVVLVICFLIGIVILSLMLDGNESVISTVLSHTSKETDNGEADKSLTAPLRAWAILFIVYFIILLIFEIWSFVIIVKCYKFFKDKAKYGQYVPGTVAYAGGVQDEPQESSAHLKS